MLIVAVWKNENYDWLSILQNHSCVKYMSLFVQSLNEVGVVVKDVIVLLDRQQGGRERLHDHGITLHRWVSCLFNGHVCAWLAQFSDLPLNRFHCDSFLISISHFLLAIKVIFMCFLFTNHWHTSTQFYLWQICLRYKCLFKSNHLACPYYVSTK